MFAVTNATTYQDIQSIALGKKIVRSATTGFDSNASLSSLNSLFADAPVNPRKAMIRSMITELEALQTMLKAA